MKVINLIQYTSDIFNTNINLWIYNSDAGNYNLLGVNTEIQFNTIYGVSIDDDHYIDFDFKSSTKIDTLLKTFSTQFINKYLCKQFIFDNDKMRYKTKKEVMSELELTSSNRVYKSCYYTTLYGIGFYCLLMSSKAYNLTIDAMAVYLKDNGIEYTNELSDQGWVCRFVIDKDVKKHNDLLRCFEID